MERTKEIQEELELLSPFLAKIGSKYPGKVPDGYFEQFPFTLPNTVADTSDLIGITKKTPYKAPDGYFDVFTANVLSAVQQTATAAVVAMEPPKKSFQRYVIAACATFLIGLSLFTFLGKQETNPASNLPIVMEQEEFWEEELYAALELDNELAFDAIHVSRMLKSIDDGDLESFNNEEINKLLAFF